MVFLQPLAFRRSLNSALRSLLRIALGLGLIGLLGIAQFDKPLRRLSGPELFLGLGPVLFARKVVSEDGRRLYSVSIARTK